MELDLLCDEEIENGEADRLFFRRGREISTLKLVGDDTKAVSPLLGM